MNNITNHFLLSNFNSNWKINEPNNVGIEDCVEIWVGQPAIKGQSFNGKWNDVSCNMVNNYMCTRAEGKSLVSFNPDQSGRFMPKV